MTYCYVHISFSLWFIDSNVQTPLSSTTINAARCSTISEDFPIDIRTNSAQNTRSLVVHYHKTNENNLSQVPSDECRSSLMPNRQRLSTILNDPNTNRYSSNIMSRSFSESNSTSNTNAFKLNTQERSISTCRIHSLTQYANEMIRSSCASLPSQTRNINVANQQRLSVSDCEHASRFLQSRRQVVKLLISLVIVFFITRLPLNILSIYIDITSDTYIPEDAYKNRTKLEYDADQGATQSLSVKNTDKNMFLVLYVNPIFQVFSLSNSTINPLCYCVMNRAAKHIFMMFQQKIRRSRKRASSLTLVQ
ncbi:unnamed protein product [Rotaria magnacalcarata]|uniref:G-protein coupled receptors family 1 profile domain-containing protein n=2 Tax=Rotaria magnacalcarata TaxID=392030 RepID=A0A815MLB8_9BILA|nr:unnamed protein product [Rotaria magnacalcarata]CAF5063008.1 unnamed protein product [Rotaria magnacalcarata]